MLASHNRFTSPVHVDAHIVSVVDLVTSLLASTVTIRVGRDFYRMVESQQLVVQSAPLSYAGMYIYFVTSPRGRFNLQPGYLTMLRGGVATEQVVVTLLLLGAAACLVQRRLKAPVVSPLASVVISTSSGTPGRLIIFIKTVISVPTSNQNIAF